MNKRTICIISLLVGLLNVTIAFGDDADPAIGMGNMTRQMGKATKSHPTLQYSEMIQDMGCPMMMNLQDVVDDYLLYKDIIGITPDQQRDLKKLKDTYRKEVIRLNAEVDIAILNLSSLLYSDTIDMKQIELANQRIEKLQSDLRTKNIETFVAARKILNEEQVKKAKEQGIWYYPYEYMKYPAF